MKDKLKRRVARLVAASMGAAGLALIPTAAHATPFYCHDPDREGNYCAKVTAIDAGSYLAIHHAANYSSGTDPGVKLHNGAVLHLGCWTTGSGDADGNGDTYWFRVDYSDSAQVGYVNDWYLTTGSPSQWKPYVGHC
ncbi:hypothetical protein LXH13_25390 [Streptomyces spinosirectus]|uniref:hypothetical protein n=1 Tax=Streptomyces spinosirectus TaxID=2906474 RepID=UPI001F1F96CD|nr:hypothetical protein [Streptomyces spinosirectus]UIR20160.1 hypothetical protein LXH13_25390 [Streptomyces spinosirectus]